MANLLGAVALLAVLSVGLCEEKNSLQRAGVAFTSRQCTSTLTVPNGGTFGDWTWAEKCPDQFFAIGFSIRVQDYMGDGDDTAMNGIRLLCAKDGIRSYMYTVESHSGYWGEWSQPQFCPSGVLSSFQLRVQSSQGLFGDDTGVNNIKFRCSTSAQVEGPGTDWGDYGRWSDGCSDGGICGINTKVQPRQGTGDDTALNNVRFHCCAKAKQ